MKRIYGIFCTAEEIVCGTTLVAIVILVFSSVIFRMLRLTMSWNIDVAMLLLAWTSFLGADCAYRRGQLVGIDIITRSLPKKLAKIIAIAVFIIILIALAFFAYYGFRLAISDSGRTYSSLPISFSWATVSLPLTAVSMIVSTLIKINQCIKGFNQGGAR
ncbi:MAG: TRAP transporter small permease subunit [Elusimicrobiota bacterium]|jgi:TRAP-type C4-dicarboxylate transport system permease small subunit|nr:TRAP transporter small permease subunit [Elusimicrobiota bacterium]